MCVFVGESELCVIWRTNQSILIQVETQENLIKSTSFGNDVCSSSYRKKLHLTWGFRNFYVNEWMRNKLHPASQDVPVWTLCRTPFNLTSHLTFPVYALCLSVTSELPQPGVDLSCVRLLRLTDLTICGRQWDVRTVQTATRHHMKHSRYTLAIILPLICNV